MSSIPTLNGSALSVVDGADEPVGVLKMLGAMVWGLALGVIGMWILIGAGLPGFLDRLTTTERMGVGIGMLCGGQLVFLMLVAWRLFPSVPARVSNIAHWGLMLVGAGCFVFVIVARLNSGGA